MGGGRTRKEGHKDKKNIRMEGRKRKGGHKVKKNKRTGVYEEGKT